MELQGVAEERKTELTDAAIDIVAAAIRDGLQDGPMWVTCYSDHGHGLLCAFEVKGKTVSDFHAFPALDSAEFPIRVVVSDSEKETRAVWLRGNQWQPDRWRIS